MLKKIEGGVTAAIGYKASGIKAGIKKSGKLDMAVITSDVMAEAAGVFTTNLVAAAPVVVSRKVAKAGKAKAVVVNSGCANACTGEQGLIDANEMAQLTAQELGIKQEEVFVSSTGIIGVTLPMDKIASGIKQAVQALDYNGSNEASKAIMTTDIYNKTVAYEFELGGKIVKIGGIAKGSG